MARRAKPLANKTGYYFLTMSSQSNNAWAAPIKSNVLQYAKLAEISSERDIDVTVGRLLKTGQWDLNAWWLNMQPNELLFEISEAFWGTIPLGPELDDTRQVDYFQLVVKVAANLLFAVDRKRLSQVFWKLFRATPLERPAVFQGRADSLSFDGFIRSSRVCLLQLAIGGPDIIPESLQDRPEMVRRILSLGYPADEKTLVSLQDKFHNHDRLQEADQAPHEPTDIDLSPKITPIVYLLACCGLSNDVRLKIAAALLSQGIYIDQFVDTSTDRMPLLAYCARYESAAFVRLLLSHGANTEKSNNRGWKPIDYALVRRDKSVLEAFDEIKYKPDWDADSIPADNALQSLLLPNNAALASFGHAPLALLLARRKDRSKSRANVMGDMGNTFMEVR